jgi:Mn2+/Fe2+ NRAMP family transporter
MRRRALSSKMAPPGRCSSAYLMMGVQEICDRTALATGQNLGQLARRKYGRWGRVVVFVLPAALMVANTLNIAADLMAVGQGMNLLHVTVQICCRCTRFHALAPLLLLETTTPRAPVRTRRAA